MKPNTVLFNSVALAFVSIPAIAFVAIDRRTTRRYFHHQFRRTLNVVICTDGCLLTGYQQPCA